MTREQFNEFVTTKQKELYTLLDQKAKEYAGDQKDAFWNFNQGLPMSFAENREQFAWELMTKHLQSIKDILSKGDYTNTSLISEKCGDVILYMFLIWGMTNDSNSNKQQG